jgi:hypothetical protein
MALSSANVFTPASGGIYVAPVGTALPTDLTTALNAAFKEVGYLGSDGLEEIPTRSTSEVKAFQNNDTVAEPTTEAKQQYTFTMIESNPVSLETYYGQTATRTTGEGTIGVNPAKTGGRKSWVFTVVDGEGVKRERQVIESGEVVEKGNVVYRNGQPVGYQVTITAYSVSGGDPVKKITTALAS